MCQASLTYQNFLPLEDVLLRKLSGGASRSIYCVSSQIWISSLSASADLVALVNFILMDFKITTWTWSCNFIIYSFIWCLCLNEEEKRKKKDNPSQLHNRSCVAEHLQGSRAKTADRDRPFCRSSWF